MKGEIPNEFRERIDNQSYIDKESLLSALSLHSDVSIRINSAKWGGKPISPDRVPWCDTGFYLKERPLFTLDPLFHAGCYYVQEASSMFLEQVVRQTGGDRPGLRILDLSAAPGGKTTHLSSLAGRGSLIVANEVIKSRAATLAENVVKWGLGNTMVTSSDPAVLGRLTGYFDTILIDAPCSGEGMFRDPDVRDEWSTQNCNLCTGRQWRIINDIWPSLKEGGHLIYSTCTFNPGENENQVARLLKEHDCTAVNVDISEFPVVIPVPDSGNRLGYGFHPGKVRGEGFFISVVRKESREEAYRPGRSAGTATIKVKNDLIPIARQYATVGEEYLADFAGTAIALPVSRQEFQMLAGLLGIIKAGTALFTLKQGSVIPAHDLAMSLLLKHDMFPEADVAAEAAIRYLRKEADIGVRFEKTGWILITFKGVKLGFIKNIGQRMNNYYPSEWRIRMESAQNHTVII